MSDLVDIFTKNESLNRNYSYEITAINENRLLDFVYDKKKCKQLIYQKKLESYEQSPLKYHVKILGILKKMRNEFY